MSNGTMLASGGYDKTIRLWDLSSGRELKTLTIGITVSTRSRGKSLRWIARKLGAEEVPTRNGGRWHPSTIRTCAEISDGFGGGDFGARQGTRSVAYLKGT